jgi:hypothetical protein
MRGDTLGVLRDRAFKVGFLDIDEGWLVNALA